MKKVSKLYNLINAAVGILMLSEVASSASLTQISLSNFSETTIAADIPEDLKPVLNQSHWNFNTGNKPDIYLSSYLPEIEFDQYGETEKTRALYPTIHKFDSTGSLVWSHFPRLNGSTLQGKLSISATKQGLLYHHQKTGLITQLDKDGKKIWQFFRDSKRKSDVSTGILAQFNDSVLVFTPKTKSIRSSNLTSSKNFQIEVLTQINKKTKQMNTIFDPLDHFDIWKSANSSEKPFEVTSFSCPINHDEKPQFICYFSTKNPVHHYSLAIETNVFGKTQGTPTRLDIPQNIMEITESDLVNSPGFSTGLPTETSSENSKNPILAVDKRMAKLIGLSSDGSRWSIVKLNSTGVTPLYKLPPNVKAARHLKASNDIISWQQETGLSQNSNSTELKYRDSSNSGSASLASSKTNSKTNRKSRFTELVVFDLQTKKVISQIPLDLNSKTLVSTNSTQIALSLVSKQEAVK